MSGSDDTIEAAYRRAEARSGRRRGNQLVGASLDFAIDVVRRGAGQTDGTESIIEMRMLRALVKNERLNMGAEPIIIDRGEPLRGQAPLLIAPQRSILSYRPDFCVVSTFADTQVVVECDGNEDHNTPEGFQRDRTRDRRLLAAGWPVMRFTYLDIAENVRACAEEVADYLLAGSGAIDG